MARRERSKDRASGGRGSSGAKETRTPQSGSFASTITDQLVRDVASFSFATPVGSYNPISSGSGNQLVNRIAIPGVMSLYWVPSIGYSDNPTSPVNIAARGLMTRVRAANSGQRNYDQTSLMLYILAVDSAFMYLAWMKRLYGLMLVVNPQSKYVPQNLVVACDGDYADLLKNMANFRAYINTFATRLYSLPIPAIPLISRHSAMSENVYLDSQSIKAQIYAFVPTAYYQYQYDTTSDLGFLAQVVSPAYKGMDAKRVPMGLNDIITFGESLLDPILITYGEEDFAIMGGDILKAYGENGVVRASGVTEDYTIVPVYDPVMLLRINNTQLQGFVSRTTAAGSPNPLFNVTQDVSAAPVTSYLRSLPAYNRYGNQAQTVPRTFSSYLLSPMGPLEPAMALEAMSFKNILSYISSNASTNVSNFSFVSAGTEVVSHASIFFMGVIGSTPSLDVSYPIEFVTHLDIDTDSGNNMDVIIATGLATLLMLSNFDYAPLVTVDVRSYTDVGTTFSDYQQPSNFLGDINDYAIVTLADLQRVRSIKLLADFGL